MPYLVPIVVNGQHPPPKRTGTPSKAPQPLAGASPSNRDTVAGASLMASYALSETEVTEIKGFESKLVELSAKVDSEVQEKNELLSRQASVERNLTRVNEFLEDEKRSLARILEGARQCIAKERHERQQVENVLGHTREMCNDLEQTLQQERRDREEERQILEAEFQKRVSVVVDELKEAQTREDKLMAKLFQVQVRALYHILQNIWRQRDMYYFSKWCWYVQEQETLRHAQELRDMNSRYNSTTTEGDYEELGHYEEPIYVMEEPVMEPQGLDVEQMDIYSMGADFGLISHETARSLSASNSPVQSREPSPLRARPH